MGGEKGWGKTLRQKHPKSKKKLHFGGKRRFREELKSRTTLILIKKTRFSRGGLVTGRTEPGVENHGTFV